MLRINLANRTTIGFIIGFMALLLSLFFITGVVAAQENMQTGDNIVVTKDQVINKDYFAGGESVTIDGTINGDAYIGAGKITVNGTINGDLIAGGGEITVTGNVTQNIRVAGGNITISGKVGRNATVLGGNLNFTNSSEITGSLVSAGGNLTIYAPIGKDLYLGAGDATLASTVGGDINAGVGNLTLSSGAKVSGDINYISEQQAQILPGASISGELKHTLPPKESKEAEQTSKYAAQGFGVYYKSATFMSLLVIGLLLIKLFPRFSLQTAQTFSSKFWNSLVFGLLALIIAPVAFILLAITVFGLPLAFILLFGFLLAIYLSKIFVSIWLGNFINDKLNQNWNLYTTFITGLIGLTLLSFIPILGALIAVTINTIGLGALLISKKNFYLKLKKDL